jgi:hypothetical protein
VPLRSCWAHRPYATVCSHGTSIACTCLSSTENAERAFRRLGLGAASNGDSIARSKVVQEPASSVHNSVLVSDPIGFLRAIDLKVCPARCAAPTVSRSLAPSVHSTPERYSCAMRAKLIPKPMDRLFTFTSALIHYLGSLCVCVFVIAGSDFFHHSLRSAAYRRPTASNRRR